MQLRKPYGSNEMEGDSKDQKNSQTAQYTGSGLAIGIALGVALARYLIS
jgi:hypothetical protein